MDCVGDTCAVSNDWFDCLSQWIGEHPTDLHDHPVEDTQESSAMLRPTFSCVPSCGGYNNALFVSFPHFSPLKPVPMSSNVSLSLPVPMYGSPFFWSILGWNRNGFGGPISYQTRGNNFSQIVEFPLCSWNFCHGLKEAWGKNKLEQTTKIVRFLRFPSTVFTIKYPQ